MVKKAEGWRIDAFKLWCWRRLLRIPWTARWSKHINLKENQPCILIVRTYAEVETPVFWLSDVNIWLIGKIPDAGKDWGQKEKSASEDEMAGWHHWCDGHELGQTLGDGERQRGLACCIPWGQKESDTTGWLKNNNKDKPTANIIFKDKKNFFPIRSQTGKGCQLSPLLFTIVLEILDTEIKKKEEFQLEKK